VTKSLTERMLEAQRYGFWIRTKLNPYCAVRWEPATHDDGRATYRGRNWVEVLPHGEIREADRYFAADVELVGPHEYLSYYPAVNEPVCGWMVEPGKYCPRPRGVTSEAIQPFCPKHQAELSAGEESNGAQESGVGDEPVPAAV